MKQITQIMTLEFCGTGKYKITTENLPEANRAILRDVRSL